MVRAKHRYFVVKLCFNNRAETDIVNIQSNVLVDYIRKRVEKYYGEFGVASMLRFTIKYTNGKTKLCIIQVSHGPHKFVSSILPLLTVAGSETARYRNLYTGSTIRQCQKFIIKYNQQYINKMIGNYKTDAKKEKFIQEVSATL